MAELKTENGYFLNIPHNQLISGKGKKSVN